MSNQLDRLESKVDKTIDTVMDISLSMAKMEVHVDKNTKDLEEHIEGVKQTRVRLERLERIDQWIRGASWVVAGLVTLTFAVLKLLK